MPILLQRPIISGTIPTVSLFPERFHRFRQIEVGLPPPPARVDLGLNFIEAFSPRVEQGWVFIPSPAFFRSPPSFLGTKKPLDVRCRFNRPAQSSKPKRFEAVPQSPNRQAPIFQSHESRRLQRQHSEHRRNSKPTSQARFRIPDAA